MSLPTPIPGEAARKALVEHPPEAGSHEVAGAGGSKLPTQGLAWDRRFSQEIVSPSSQGPFSLSEHLNPLQKRELLSLGEWTGY